MVSSTQIFELNYSLSNLCSLLSCLGDIEKQFFQYWNWNKIQKMIKTIINFTKLSGKKINFPNCLASTTFLKTIIDFVKDTPLNQKLFEEKTVK